MTKLVECVPNFSEGRDRAVIDAITAEIAAVAATRASYHPSGGSPPSLRAPC